eukprot:1874093-Pyramimonas_sp.AAC.1
MIQPSQRLHCALPLVDAALEPCPPSGENGAEGTVVTPEAVHEIVSALLPLDVLETPGVSCRPTALGSSERR